MHQSGRSFREISTGAVRLGLALIEEFAVRSASAADPEHRQATCAHT
ncbi:hypothetical protein AB0E01_06325 [Nocardia vinacea]